MSHLQPSNSVAKKMGDIPQVSTPQQLEQVLAQLLVPNNESIKKAEIILKQFCKQSHCIPAFVQQIQSSSSAPIRQLSAIIMRAKLKNHWEKINQSMKQDMKKAVLQILITEPEPTVRNSVISVVSEIASFEVPKNAWNELAAFLMTNVKSTVAAHREMVMSLFASLFDSVSEQMIKNLSQTVPIFLNGLNDQNLNVRFATLKTLQTVVSRLTTADIEPLYKLIPSIVENLKECLKSGQETIASEAFQIFDEMVELKTQSFNTYIPNLLKFMLDVSKSKNLEVTTRDRALNFVGWVATFNRGIILSNKLIEPVLTSIFQLLMEISDEEIEEDCEDDEITIFTSSLSLLDEVCIHLPSKHIFQPIIQFAVPLVKSEDPKHRKVAVSVIGVLAEGCIEPVKNNLNIIMDILLNGCHDKHPGVREAACLSLGNMAQFIQPEILEYYEKVIPAVMKTITDKSFKVKEKSCFTLDTFLQYMGEKVIPFLDPIMKILIELLSKSEKKTQEMIIPAIANVANAARSSFTPYAPGILNMLTLLLETNNNELLQLRSRAMECVGIIGVAIGKQQFAPYIEKFMTCACKGLSLGDPTLKELTYCFFGNVAQVLEFEFDRYLKVVINPVIESACAEDEVENIKNTKLGFNLDDDDDDDEDEDDDNDRDTNNQMTREGSHQSDIEVKSLGINIRTSLIEEKSSAITTLGKFAKACRHLFFPYLEKTLEILGEEYSHFHYEVRRSVSVSLREMVYAIPPSWDSQQKLKLLQKIVDIYISILIEDDDKETVARACEAMSSLCKQFGKDAVERQIKNLSKIFLLLLQKRSPCNENDIDDDDTDHDIVLIDAVSDLIDDVAKAMGPAFEPYFRPLFPELVKYAKPSRAVDDQVMAIGTMSEVANAIQSAIIPYANQILAICMAALRGKNQNILRNSAYCVGVLSIHAKEQFSPYVNLSSITTLDIVSKPISSVLLQVLQLLHPIFTNPKKHASFVLDNACGAVARMIISHEQKIPLDQVFPVFLSILPLREDFLEYEPVVSCILNLLSNSNPCVTKYVGSISQLLCQIVQDPNTPTQCKQRIASAALQMKDKYPHLQQVLAISQTNTGSSLSRQ